MKNCFVIQPFDKGVFDQRYNDVFKQAIINAGMNPYRVDEDPAVKIPIEDIAKGIEDSEICFAEITTDNPNVWYELGYALASKKDVILVCESEKRNGKYPFDIQHRKIISYKSNSPSDFQELGNKITEKIKSITKKTKKIEEIIDNPLKESKGLKQHEITLMILLVGQQFTDQDSVSVFSLQNDMSKAGFTDAATSISIRNLKRIGFIDTEMERGNNFEESYPVCRLTKKGEDWILENQDEIKFRYDNDYQKQSNSIPEEISDEIPF